MTAPSDLLRQAEAYQARNAGWKPVTMTAREAVQNAETARLLALKRQEDERVAQEKQAAADREAAARAAADESARQKAMADAQAAEAARREAEAGAPGGRRHVRRQRLHAHNRKRTGWRRSEPDWRPTSSSARPNRRGCMQQQAEQKAQEADRLRAQAEQQQQAVAAAIAGTVQPDPGNARYRSRTDREHVGRAVRLQQVHAAFGGARKAGEDFRASSCRIPACAWKWTDTPIASGPMSTI